MKVLITGITGFVGSHLVDFLIAHHPEVEIFGIKRWRSKMENLDQTNGKINFYECDMKDAHNVYDIIDRIKPDKIFHLAAQSFVPASWESPSETFETNIIGQCNIFEAVRKIKSDTYNPVIQIAGSSEEYGLVKPDETPITEENPLRPLSPYAVSKITQDFMGYQYFKSYGLKIIRTRAFNHSGPRRGEVFVDSSFAKQIAEIEAGLHDPFIEVGNLESVRDFTDVRDIVAAYWLATEKCQPGEVYNICSGQGYTIHDMLNKLISLSAAKKIEIRFSQNRMRPSDVPVLLGSYDKFKKATGWAPRISYFDKTLIDTLDYWRAKTKHA
jgi:GDP-4-dehydro-6-deoxy-D-mannose reductase